MAAWINRPWIEELLIREEHSVWLTRPRRGQVIQILSEPKRENDFNACIVVSDKKLFVKVCLGQSCLENFFKKNKGENIVDLKGVNVTLLKYKIRHVLECKKNQREFQIIVEELDSPGGCKSSQFGDELINASRFEPIEKRLTLLWRQLQIQKLSLDPAKISLHQHRCYQEISPADLEKLDQISEWRSDFVHKPSQSSCSSSAALEHQPSYSMEISPIVAENSPGNHNFGSMGRVQSKEIAAAATETGSDVVKNNCQQSTENANPSVTNDKERAIPISVPCQSNGTCSNRAAEDAKETKNKLVKTVISAPDIDLHFVEQTQGFDVSEDGVSALRCRIASGERITSGEVHLQSSLSHQNTNGQENTQGEQMQDIGDSSTESVTTEPPLPPSNSYITATSKQVSDTFTSTSELVSDTSNRAESLNDPNANDGGMQSRSSTNVDNHRAENNDKTKLQMVFTSDDESDNNERNKYEILINSFLQSENESPKKLPKSQKDSLTKPNVSDRIKPELSLTLTTEEKEQSDQVFNQGLDTILKSPEYEMLKTSNSRVFCFDPNNENTRTDPNDDLEGTINNAIAQTRENKTGASVSDLKTEISNHTENSKSTTMADSSTSNTESRIIDATIRERVGAHQIFESENVCNSTDTQMDQCLKAVNDIFNELTVSSSVVPGNDPAPDANIGTENSDKEITVPIAKPRHSEQQTIQQDQEECSPSMTSDSSTTIVDVADDMTSGGKKSSNNVSSDEDEESAKHTETNFGQSHQNSDQCKYHKESIVADDLQEIDSSYKKPWESEVEHCKVSSQRDIPSTSTPHTEQQIVAPTDSQKSPSMSQLVDLLIDSGSGSLCIDLQSSLSSTEAEIATDGVLESSGLKDNQNSESLAVPQCESVDVQSLAGMVIERNETGEEGNLENIGSSSNYLSIYQSIELVDASHPEFVDINSGTINKHKTLEVNHPDSKDTLSVSKNNDNLPNPNVNDLPLSPHSLITVKENETAKADLVITSSSNLENASSLSEQPDCIVSSQGDPGSLLETSGTKPEEEGSQNEASSTITDFDGNLKNSFSSLNISENIVSSQSDVQQQPREAEQGITSIEYGDSINISELSRLTPTVVDSQSEVYSQEDAVSNDKTESTDLESHSTPIMSLLEEHDVSLQQDNKGTTTPSLPVQNDPDAKFVRPQPKLNVEKDRKRRRQMVLHSFTGTSNFETLSSSSRTETNPVDTGSQIQREKQKRKFDEIDISDSDSTDVADGSYSMLKKSMKRSTSIEIGDNDETSNNRRFHPTATGTSSIMVSDSSTDETDRPPIYSSNTGSFSILASHADLVSQETEYESPWKASKGSEDTKSNFKKRKGLYSARVNNYEDWLGRNTRDYCFSNRAKTKLADKTIDWSVFKRFHPNIDHLR